MVPGVGTRWLEQSVTAKGWPAKQLNIMDEMNTLTDKMLPPADYEKSVPSF